MLVSGFPEQWLFLAFRPMVVSGFSDQELPMVVSGFPDQQLFLDFQSNSCFLFFKPKTDTKKLRLLKHQFEKISVKTQLYN